MPRLLSAVRGIVLLLCADICIVRYLLVALEEGGNDSAENGYFQKTKTETYGQRTAELESIPDSQGKSKK